MQLSNFVDVCKDFYNGPMKVHLVTAKWDDEAKVWVAMSDDVPGLVTEAATLELLNEKLKVMVPEFLEENGLACDADNCFELIARRFNTLKPVQQ
jgi:predicted RNase H-like HicB family nuclease